MNRNQKFEYAECTIACLGDPHLGKKFKTGVPVNRLGEREQMVLQDFRDSLMDPDPELTIHVCMGDLFDKAIVDYQTIFAAYFAYIQAAAQFPDRKYFIIMGNHDMSRNSDRYSSFQVFAQMLDSVDNIKLIIEPDHYEGFGFIPYHPFKTSVEMLFDYRTKFGTLDTYAVFGHWDVDTFNSEMPHNIFPVDDIKTLPQCREAYTGHIHQSGLRDYNGLELTITGSMQPYSFAEDSTGEFYVTLSLAELYKTDPRTLQKKCVRVLLNEGEVLPELDCLQLIGKRFGEAEFDEDIDVEMAAFDMQALMLEELQKAGVKDQKTIGFVISEFDRFKAEEV